MILFTLCLLILIWRLILVHYYQVDTIRTYYATDTRIDSILFGAITAVYWNPIHDKASNKMGFQQYIILITSLLILAFSFLYRDEQFRETFRYTIQGIALAPLFYLAIKYSEHPLFHILNWKWVTKLGVYSYFIYLIHYIIVRILIDNEVTDSIAGLIILTSILSILYAFILDEYFDSYFRKLWKIFR